MDREKVILDTDIGTDIDDAICLAYLLAQPRCDLLGITTVSGQADLRARMCSSICKVAGRDVPIFPGVEVPLLTKVMQPHAGQSVKLSNWAHETEFPQGKAVEFLYDAIRNNPGEVTLLAIGPMTNIGLLFATHPDSIGLIKRLVLMCGRFESGVQGSAEWNALNDPIATAIVYNARPALHRSYGLDVTLKLQMAAGEVKERFTHPYLKPVLDYSSVWFENRPLITFHDPLAGLSIFDEVCTYARGTVRGETHGPCAGMTAFREEEGGPHEIARAVDAGLFYERFFGVMSA